MQEEEHENYFSVIVTCLQTWNLLNCFPLSSLTNIVVFFSALNFCITVWHGVHSVGADVWFWWLSLTFPLYPDCLLTYHNLYELTVCTVLQISGYHMHLIPKAGLHHFSFGVVLSILHVALVYLSHALSSAFLSRLLSLCLWPRSNSRVDVWS